MKQSALCLISALIGVGGQTVAQSAAPDLNHSTMEQLAAVQINVNSASRKDENVFQTSAAVYVITRAEIAQSSAESIPDLLRGVPGLQVAQINASTWAVSARGFNSSYANKLLVLIDGRTLYSEIYSGANWDEINMPRSNIERIEVVRGPGAAVWGTNAVNGVINIITRSARTVSAPGLTVRFSRILNFGMLEAGGTLGDSLQYRGFLSYTDRRPLVRKDGSDAFDGQSLFRLGGRVDWKPSSANRYSFLSDVYRGRSRQQLDDDLSIPANENGQIHDSTFGGFALGRWEHTGAHLNSELQAYYVLQRRDTLRGEADTLTNDYDFINHSRPNSRMDFVWGSNLRLTRDTDTTSELRSPQYKNYLVSGFLQSGITLKPNRLQLTVGSKVQNGTLAGFQVQPSIRLGWSVRRNQFLWAAVSRAAVAPALQDKYLNTTLDQGTYNGLPARGSILGNPDFKPEQVIAYEVGGRHQFGNTFSVDVSTFYDLNQRIQSVTAETPTLAADATGPYVQQNFLYGNGYSVQSEGVETSVHWKPLRKLEIEANHTWLECRTEQNQPGPITLLDSWTTPRNAFYGRMRWKPAPRLVFSVTLSHVGVVPSSSEKGAQIPSVPDYTRLDVRLSRKFGSHAAFDLGGTNLQSPRHLEFEGGGSTLKTLNVPRSLFMRASWSF